MLRLWMEMSFVMYETSPVKKFQHELAVLPTPAPLVAMVTPTPTKHKMPLAPISRKSRVDFAGLDALATFPGSAAATSRAVSGFFANSRSNFGLAKAVVPERE